MSYPVAPDSGPRSWTAALAALTAGAATLAVLLPTVAPGILQGDPGEFQLAARIGGIAHPTGYPLYLMLGWAWMRLPWSDVPGSMSLLSAVFAAASASLSVALALRLTPGSPLWLRAPAAIICALWAALGPIAWSQSIVAEVYTLHTTLWLATILAMMVWARQPARWWYIALLVGLSLAHHRMTVLYLPAVAAMLWAEAERRPSPRQLGAVALAMLAPLALYAYIPLRASSTPYLRLPLWLGEPLSLYDQTPGGFLRFISGQAFGGALQPEGLGNRAAAAVAWTTTEMMPPVLVLAGLVWLAWRRVGAGLLLGLALLANVAFNLLYAIGDIHVFYIPVYAVAAVLAAVGLAGPAAKWRSWRYLGLMATVAFAVALVVRVPGARAAALASVPTVPEGLWESVLTEAPADAIIFSNDRNEVVPLWYHQYALGQRPDLTGVFPLISPTPEYADVGQLVGRALASGRTACTFKEMDGLRVGFQMEPAGETVRCVLGTWQLEGQVETRSLSPELDLAAWNAPATVPAGSTLEVTLYWRASAPLAEPYSSYVHLVRADGSATGVGSDHRPGGDYLPANLWQPGQAIRDVHALTLPTDLPPGTYLLLVGMYSYPSLTGYGDALTLGGLEVTPAAAS